MANQYGKGNREKQRGKRALKCGERNGFDDARILPLSSSEAAKRTYEHEAEEIITRFLRSGESSEMLPVMNREQRIAMHEAAKAYKLMTKSYGKEPKRCIVISLRNAPISRVTLTDPIVPSQEVLDEVNAFVVENPITKPEREHFLTERENKMYQWKGGSTKSRAAVPPKASCPNHLKKAREQLPASSQKQRVLKAIENCGVVIISGGTGCGKTTQVPQFILENACEKNEKVRIVVTQPRRIAAISISERVAKERGENLGDTVGFQVRLESKQCEKTLLTYCTTGVLLRILTSDPVASGITHIIMDEIHEREINTDYLLIAIRECIQRRPDLKIILMSATIEGNMNLFIKYFDTLKLDIIRIESRTFDVKTFHLDQILAMTGYEPPDVNGFFAPFSFNWEDWKEELDAIHGKEESQKQIDQKVKTNSEKPKIALNAQVVMTPYEPLSVDTSNAPEPYFLQDRLICNRQDTPVADASGEWVSGDYLTCEGEVIPEKQMKEFWSAMGESETRPLLIAFRPDSPESVFVNGVRYTTSPDQPPDALKQQKEDRESMPDCLVEVHCTQPVKNCVVAPVDTLAATKTGLGQLTADGGFGFGEKYNSAQLLEKKFREEMKTVIKDRPTYYHPKVNEKVDRTDFVKLRFSEKYEMFYGVDFRNSIDHNLVDHLVKYLADSSVHGSILVFLPGYDDIQEMTNKIDMWKDKLQNIDTVVVIPLHSQMHSIDHGEIFKSVKRGTRKIILATNIAEASITIEDVIFVVDTGKAKEKAYNHEAKLSTLTVSPIAKSNAQQRSGRAGRVANGYCFRLYSEREYEDMPETQVAEMKRAAIYDVTLHAKLFAPNQMRIADFLSLAPEPPTIVSIEQSMAFLEQIGALYSPKKYTITRDDDTECDEDKDPDLTDLGRLMSRLPLDPQLSRMLLFGLALKCLTPIINLVAMLSNREPFILPSPESREDQTRVKNALGQSDFSDHLMFIRVCSNYVSKSSNQAPKFCREHLLSYSTMRMVTGTRRQLVQELLRAKLIYLPPDRDLLSVLSDRNFNKHSDSWPMVQAAIAAGCYPSIGASNAESKLKKVHTFNDKPAGLHPSSILKKQVLKLNKPSLARSDPRIEYVAFQELAQMPFDKSLSIKMVTAIPSITALLFTGPIRLNEQVMDDYQLVNVEGEEIVLEQQQSEFGDSISTFELDSWYGVRVEKQTLRQLLRLRHKFMHFFLKGIHNPSMFGQDTPEMEVRMLETIRNLLETEHTRSKYNQVIMPNFYLKDFPPYSNQYKQKQTKTTSSKQTSGFRKANNEVGEKSTSTSDSSQQQPRTTWKRQQSRVTATHQFNVSAPAFNASVPPPDVPQQYNFGNTSSHNAQWAQMSPQQQASQFETQNGWPQQSQSSWQYRSFNEQQQTLYPQYQQQFSTQPPRTQNSNSAPMGGYVARGRGGPRRPYGSRGGWQNRRQSPSGQKQPNS